MYNEQYVDYTALNDLISRLEFTEEHLVNAIPFPQVDSEDFTQLFNTLKYSPFADMYHFRDGYFAMVLNSEYSSKVVKNHIFHHVKTKLLKTAGIPQHEISLDEADATSNYGINEFLATVVFYTRRVMRPKYRNVKLDVLKTADDIHRITLFIESNYSTFGGRYFLAYVRGLNER